MRLTLLILVAAVVVASGCVSDSEPQTENDQQVDDAPTTSGPAEDTSSPSGESTDNSNTVTFTDSGFEPNTLTIDQGETVTWVDESSTGMWVATDRHPTHTNYAGTSVSEHCQNGDETEAAFDQCQASDSYSFTFEKTGTWSYHNHVAANYGGEIIVE